MSSIVTTARLICPLDTYQGTVFLIGKHVEVSVWPLHNISYAVFEFGQQTLAANLLASTIENDALQMTRTWNAPLHHGAYE